MVRRLLCLICLAFGLSLSAQAADLCVSTTNDLGAALVAAQTAKQTIQLVQGTYRLDLTPANSGVTVAKGTSILGGYNAGCTSRDIAAGNTLLTDNSAPANNAYEFFPVSDFTIEGLTFDLHARITLYAGSFSDNATVVVRRSVFRGTSTTNQLGVIWTGDPSTNGVLRVENVLARGSTGHAYCSVAVEDDLGGMTAYFTNNTLINATCGLGAFDLTPNLRASYKVYNNIIYNNSEMDIDYNTSDFTLVDNTFSVRTGPAPVTSPVGSSSAAPQLDGSYRPTVPTSPAIDSGTQIIPGGVPATDLDGGPRVVGDNIDRGAYETNYDNSTKQSVTNTSDSGLGSLRQAIMNANNTSGSNTIQFNIPGGCGPQVIKIDSNLDTITGDTKIEGFTQTGASRNDLGYGNNAVVCVILESHNAAATNGLRVGVSAGTGVNLNVSGMGFSGFTGDAIGLMGGSAHSVAGNHFGGNVGGHNLNPNGTNVRIGVGVSKSIVGGSDPGQLNVIGDATGAGVFIAGTTTPATDNQVAGNLIGLGWSNGFISRPNGGNGVEVAGASNFVAYNFIGSNGGAGIELETANALNNVVVSNFIGTDYFDTDLGNGGAGVLIDNSASMNEAAFNTIAHNGGAGVRVISGEKNNIRINSIYQNSGLGIDISLVGVTDNDDDAVGTRWQNFPTISQAIGGHNVGVISGNLTTTPGNYDIDVFAGTGCDASGHGEGRTWLGDIALVVPSPVGGADQGSKNFTMNVHRDFPFVLTGSTITLTATDLFGNTSEFSSCKAYTDDTIFSDGYDNPQI